MFQWIKNLLSFSVEEPLKGHYKEEENYDLSDEKFWREVWEKERPHPYLGIPPCSGLYTDWD